MFRVFLLLLFFGLSFWYFYRKFLLNCRKFFLFFALQFFSSFLFYFFEVRSLTFALLYWIMSLMMFFLHEHLSYELSELPIFSLFSFSFSFVPWVISCRIYIRYQILFFWLNFLFMEKVSFWIELVSFGKVFGCFVL